MTKVLLATLTALLVAGFNVEARADAESYQELTGAPADYRSSVASPLDGADSTDWSAPLVANGPSRTLIPTKGNPTVYVRADLSVPGATVAVYCGLWHVTATTKTFLGIAGVSTATASGTPTRASGRYLHEGLLIFDTASATHVELRKTDPTNSATVSLYPWLGGAQPRGAGSD